MSIATQGNAGARCLVLTDGAGAVVSPNPGSALRYSAGNLELSVDGGPYGPIGAAAGLVTFAGQSAEFIDPGAPVAIIDIGTGPRIWMADADDSVSRRRAIGICTTGAPGAGSPVIVQVAGVVTIADAIYAAAAPGVGDVGAPVWLSNTRGKLQLTPPPVGSSQRQIGSVRNKSGGAASELLIEVANNESTQSLTDDGVTTTVTDNLALGAFLASDIVPDAPLTRQLGDPTHRMLDAHSAQLDLRADDTNTVKASCVASGITVQGTAFAISDAAAKLSLSGAKADLLSTGAANDARVRVTGAGSFVRLEAGGVDRLAADDAGNITLDSTGGTLVADGDGAIEIGTAGATAVDVGNTTTTTFTTVNGKKGVGVTAAQHIQVTAGTTATMISDADFGIQSTNGKVDILVSPTGTSVDINGSAPALTNIGTTGGMTVMGGAVSYPDQIQPDYGALTDATGGTAGATLVDVTTLGLADPAKVNDDLASINAKLDAIRAVLQAAGLMS